MAPPQGRSAALLISVYMDTQGGAHWYARLRAFDDPMAAGADAGHAATEEQLIQAVRQWLTAVTEKT